MTRSREELEAAGITARNLRQELALVDQQGLEARTMPHARALVARRGSLLAELATMTAPEPVPLPVPVPGPDNIVPPTRRAQRDDAARRQQELDAALRKALMR